MIRRWQRELKQKEVLSRFYSGAETLIESEIEVNRLLAELRGSSQEVVHSRNGCRGMESRSCVSSQWSAR